MQKLASEDDLKRAQQWGLAIRLAQRLSGGVAAPLKQSSVSLGDAKLVLTIKGDVELLLGDAVERRLRQLAASLGKSARFKSLDYFQSCWARGSCVSGACHGEFSINDREGQFALDKSQRIPPKLIEAPVLQHREAGSLASRKEFQFL